MRLYGKNGFTMIEMLIVVVIIGIIAGLAVPNFAGAIQKIRWRSTATEITKALRLARSSAITKNDQFGVNVDYDKRHIVVFKDLSSPSSYSFDEVNDSIVSLDTIDGNVDGIYSSFANGSVCFFPNGRASESGFFYGHRYSETSYQMFNISVLAATGRATIDYMEN
jgi:prepilin-type N-terminal cleavage/methylation domain-containing protein